MNERITEDLVREILKQNLKNYENVCIEEQQTQNKRIQKLLKNASKQGNGLGKPEFIITFDEINELIIIIECKADIKKHKSKNLDNPKDYAVDGVLLYAEYLSKEFDVIAIAVSGQEEEKLKISNFLQLKNKYYKEIEGIKISSFEEYIQKYRYDPDKKSLELNKVLKYSKKLHADLREVAKLSETQKPLLVSAILIVLNDESFVASYRKKKKPINISKLILSTLLEILEHAELPNKKIISMLLPYRFIEEYPILITEKRKGKQNTVLLDLIIDIEENVKPFSQNYLSEDILGRFYGEFLRYTAGDKKWLGIVITPKHITQLFSYLADVQAHDVVLDTCCGTGGFLISAMDKMIKESKGDNQKILNIKKNQLIGIEQLPNMFALACANMILRGDGKANLYEKDCFDIVDSIKKSYKCTVGFLNPPYAQVGEGLTELDYIQNSLDYLEKGSYCIAIIPMGCVIQPTQLKMDLLKHHTLESVMSLPDELFYPIGTVPCIIVFKAKIPHNPSRKTWFGYWKDDGFVKTHTEGRIDKYNNWEKIREKWIENFINKKEIPGECVLHSVTGDEEWCAEAFMETDYKKITPKEFEIIAKEYGIFNIMNGMEHTHETK